MQRHVVPEALIIGETLLHRILGDPDHGGAGHRAFSDSHALTERILPGPKRFRHSLTHDGNPRSSDAIIRPEGPTPQDPRPRRREVVWRGLLIRESSQPADGINAGDIQVRCRMAPERYAAHDRGVFNSRKRLSSLQKALLQGDRGSVTKRESAKVASNQDDAIGVIAQANVADPIQAANEESGSHEQGDR